MPFLLLMTGVVRLPRFRSSLVRASALSSLLWLSVFLVFVPALRGDFLNYDDDVYVTANPHVTNGLSWQNAVWAFKSIGTASNWHPLTWLSHMIDWQVFGARAWGHHLSSILLHAANSVLLFWALKLLT